MPRFILEIELSPGSSVYSPDEVATVIRLLANHLNIISTREMHTKDIVGDINGNVVGQYQVVE